MLEPILREGTGQLVPCSRRLYVSDLQSFELVEQGGAAAVGAAYPGDVSLPAGGVFQDCQVDFFDPGGVAGGDLIVFAVGPLDIIVDQAQV